MTTETKKTGTRFAAAIAGAAILLATAGTASADTSLRGYKPEERRQASLSIAPKPDRATKSKRVYLGRAPWICTPSGFGRTATCFLRASLK